MHNRTKILATLGPASNTPDVIEKMVLAGCHNFRINFSHGTYDEHAATLEAVRQVEEKLARPLCVCGDLCGPKIRTTEMKEGVELIPGSEVKIARQLDGPGDANVFATSLPAIIDDVQVDENILLNDGKLQLRVTAVGKDEITCEVIVGGPLTSHKGVNLPDTNLKLSALTEKDRRDAEWISSRSFDYVCLSFVQRGDDVAQLREVLAANDCDARIIVKIEKPKALENIEEIITLADAVMVARGDLGVEMPLPSVPVAQKTLAKLCQQKSKPCIIATQMLESMIEAPTPTRAEVSDVANAVLDHTDAVMLSAESAVGKYPVEAVQFMADIVSNIQAYHDEINPIPTVDVAGTNTEVAIAQAVREVLAVETDISAISAYTLTGATARLLAKSRPPRPILAITPCEAAARKMCLYYAVEPKKLSALPEHFEDIFAEAQDLAEELELTKVGQKLIVVTGKPFNKPGNSNALIIHSCE